MSSVVIAGDTSGSITLSAPAVAGSNTITLPASTGTVVTTGTPATGNVIQVVNFSTSTEQSTSSSTFTDTALTATITPKFATSKILVIIDQNGVTKQVNDTNAWVRLVRNSTTLINIEGGAGNTNTSSVTNDIGTVGCNYLDSPATTSATTYKTQFASRQNNGLVYVNYAYTQVTTSTITLMEIAQ